MKTKQTIIALATGVAIGMGAAGPVALAAENWLRAYPSTQTFYVDGQQVELEAYEIGGYNYIKLRDMGRAVGFDVSYDPASNSALILTGTPYVDESQSTSTPTPITASTNYSAQANPTVFTSDLTPEIYNGIKDSMVHREEILAGSHEPLPITGVADPNNLASLGVSIGLWPSYQFKRNADGQVVCLPRYAEAWQGAADHCQPFLDSLAGQSDREKVRQLDFYVCDRMTYAVQSAGIGTILSQDGVVPSYCMNYAYCFKFLCDMADIPCVLVYSDIHMWNEVYVEGRWWSVDVTGDDCGDDLRIRDSLKILHTAEDIQGTIYADAQPQVTAFAKELLAPGSTTEE